MKKRLIMRGRDIRKVGFFGLGKSTLSLLDFLIENYVGLEFTLRSDTSLKCENHFSNMLFGKAARENFFEDVIFLSPSVRRDTSEFCEAAKNGVIFSSDAEFFFEQKKIPVISVTGSDGKSTTATLASLMLSNSGQKFPVSGNVGLPMTSLLSDTSLCGTVAELSSFQLMNFTPASERALITNVSPNHLDWHTSLEEYVSAKENILRLAEKRIFNLDCGYNLTLISKYPAYAVYSRNKSYREISARFAANHYFTVEDGVISVSGEPIFKVSDIKIKGEHNLSNVLAATATVWEKASPESIVRAVTSFNGLRHRTEQVGTFDGISFFDSSIDSTPTRTAATLSSISSPVVLILGGRGKNLSYSPLLSALKNVRAIIITGENRDDIERELRTSQKIVSGDIAVRIKEDFFDAVTAAIEIAKSGDTVLLSPASTSFDRFADYKERGKVFSDIIKKYYAEK